MADTRTTTPHLEKYYSKRASEYEQIYEKPERQHELEWLRNRIPMLFRGKTVLEVACGTGYWTVLDGESNQNHYYMHAWESKAERERVIDAFITAPICAFELAPPSAIVCRTTFASSSAPICCGK